MASFNPGWHDAAIGDVDGDGDIDIVTKIWNKDGATYHADYWRNDAIVRLDNGVDLAGWHSAGGLWQVGGGAIVGQQNPPGSGNGGLLLSDRSFGDFEVTFEVWPDWGVDTGLYTRTTADGKAYQVTIDYQAGNPQVHDSPAEWPKGAVARFRNIRIRDLSENSWAPDSLAPTAPSNLEITAVTASSVSLQWPASIDDVGVSGYRVFRNGVEAGTAVSTHFTDAGLASDAACIYTVRAFDAAGNVSGPSTPLTARTLAVGVGGAVPTHGLAFWVRADAGVTLDASGVSEWADQSGHRRDAVQPAAASRPRFAPDALHGKPAIRFDGLDDFFEFGLPINGSTGLTVVLVSANAASRDPGANQGSYAPIFWGETTSWGWTYLSPFQSNIVMRFGTTQTGNLFKYTRPSPIGNAFTMTVGVHDNTADSLYVNGSLVMRADGKRAPIAGTVDVPCPGRGASGTCFPGDIAEVLVYTRALPPPERIDLENRLRSRYLPGHLPTLQITRPAGNARFVAPAAIDIAADVSSTNASIAKVEFFAENIPIGQKTNPPYSIVWSNAAAGAYTLVARATDSLGAAGLSAPAPVIVDHPCGFVRPTPPPTASPIMAQRKAALKMRPGCPSPPPGLSSAQPRASASR